MRGTLLTLGAVLVLSPPAGAYALHFNAPLDRVLSPDEKERLVLFVEVREIVRGPLNPTGPQDEHAVFHVRGVLRGSPELAGRDLRLYVGDYSWPQRLVPIAAGERALLILPGPDGPVEVLLPALREAYEPVGSREALRGLLARDLMEELTNRCGEDRERVRQLILTVAPILTAGEAAPLKGFLSDGNPWLRRAALAGFVHATKDPEAMKLAVADLEAFLPKHGWDKFIPHPYLGDGYNSYSLFFEHYFFLSARWRDGGDPEAAAFLPLFRAVERSTRHAPFDRWFFGIKPLVCAGNREDLELLHAEYRSRLERKDDAGGRQWLLLGMGRILGLDLPILTSEGFATCESFQYQRVRAALKKAGLLD